MDLQIDFPMDLDAPLAPQPCPPTPILIPGVLVEDGPVSMSKPEPVPIPNDGPVLENGMPYALFE